MDEFCLIHASDLQLDRPWHGLRRPPPRIAGALANAPVETWEKLVHLAVETGAAGILLAGGMGFATRYVGVRERVARTFQGLADRRIPVFALKGHEGDQEEDADWLDDLIQAGGGKLFGRAVETAPVMRDGDRIATVHATSLPVAGSALLGQHTDGDSALGFRVGILRFSGENGEQIERTRSLRGMDYWALGGEPCYACLGQGHRWIVYPGTPQGRSFATEELGAKGAVVMTVRGGWVERADFEPLDQVRAVTIDVDGSSLENRAALQRDLCRQAEHLRGQHSDRSLIVRAVIRAGTAVPAWLRATNLDEFIEQLRRAGDDERERFLWWDSLQVEPHPWAQPARRPVAGALDSAVAQVAQELRGDPERLSRTIAERLAPLQSRLGPRLHRRKEAEDLELLRMAEQRVMGALEDGRDER